MSHIQYDKQVLTFLIPILSLIWILVSFRAVIFTRNILFLTNAVQVPDILNETYTQEQFDTGNQYGYLMSIAMFITEILSATLTTIFLVFQLYIVFWNWSLKIWKQSDYKERENVLTLTFITILRVPKFLFQIIVIATTIPSPETTPGSTDEIWDWDHLLLAMKMMAANNAFAVIFMIAIYILIPFIDYILGKDNTNNLLFWLWISPIFSLAFGLIFIKLGFVSATQLPTGELKEGLKNVTERVGYPFKSIYYNEYLPTNAFCLSAFGLNTIGVTGKFFSNYTGNSDGSETYYLVNEIVGVVAHELGHWNYDHVLIFFLVIQLEVTIVCSVAYLLFKTDGIYRIGGFHDVENGRPIIISIYLIFYEIGDSFMTGTGYLKTAFASRSFEYAADRFSKNLGYAKGLESSLIKLTMEYNSPVDVDRWYSFFLHGHPTLVERILALRE